MWKTSLACGLIALGATTFTAHAADMPLFPQPTYGESDPPPQFEFGTGWYLRGDLSASDGREVAYSQSYLGTLAGLSANDPNLAQALAREKQGLLTTRQDWGYAVGGGFGYKFNDYFRTDVTGDYLSTQRFGANTSQTVDNVVYSAVGSGTVRRWDALVNAYIDLGNWRGFQPYIGAGVGVASLRTKGSIDITVDGVRTGPDTGSPGQYNLAWAAMAGIGYQIAPHMLLDVGYRFLDLGDYKAPVSGERKSMTEQQARVGIRYTID